MSNITMVLALEGVSFEVPAKWEICSSCAGEGRVMNPSIANHAYTQEDMDEDPEFAEEYRKGAHGVYGVWCAACDRKGKVKVPDPKTAKERKIVEAWYKVQREKERDDREWANEIETQYRMGGGRD